MKEELFGVVGQAGVGGQSREEWNPLPLHPPLAYGLQLIQQGQHQNN